MNQRTGKITFQCGCEMNITPLSKNICPCAQHKDDSKFKKQALEKAHKIVNSLTFF